MNEGSPENSMEQYDKSIAYEVLRDAVNSEIARHMEALRTNPQSQDSCLHDSAINDLIEARQTLNPDNPEAIHLATLIMRSYRDKVAEELINY